MQLRIDEGETPREAALGQLWEELGTSKVEIIAETAVGIDTICLQIFQCGTAIVIDAEAISLNRSAGSEEAPFLNADLQSWTGPTYEFQC